MAPLADALTLLGLHHTAAHLDDLVALDGDCRVCD